MRELVAKLRSRIPVRSNASADDACAQRNDEKVAVMQPTSKLVEVKTDIKSDDDLVPLDERVILFHPEDGLPGDLYAQLLIATEWMADKTPLAAMEPAQKLILHHHFNGLIKAIGRYQDRISMEIGDVYNSWAGDPTMNIELAEDKRQFGRSIISDLLRTYGDRASMVTFAAEYETWKDQPTLRDITRTLLKDPQTRQALLDRLEQYSTLTGIRRDLAQKSADLDGKSLDPRERQRHDAEKSLWTERREAARKIGSFDSRTGDTLSGRRL